MGPAHGAAAGIVRPRTVELSRSPEPEPPPAEDERPRCPECGAPREAEAEHCPECGTELGGADEGASAAASAPQ